VDPLGENLFRPAGACESDLKHCKWTPVGSHEANVLWAGNLMKACEELVKESIEIASLLANRVNVGSELGE
jgi:hypothetical protein